MEQNNKKSSIRPRERTTVCLSLTLQKNHDMIVRMRTAMATSRG